MRPFTPLPNDVDALLCKMLQKQQEFLIVAQECERGRIDGRDNAVARFKLESELFHHREEHELQHLRRQCALKEMKLQKMARDSGFEWVQLRRLSYLCGVVDQPSLVHLRPQIERGLYTDLEDDERLLAAIELVAYLQVSGLTEGDAYGVTAAICGSVRRIHSALCRGSGSLAKDSDTQEGRLDAALGCLDRAPVFASMTSVEFQQRVDAFCQNAIERRSVEAVAAEGLSRLWREDGRTWDEFHHALHRRRAERMSEGRNCLVASVIRSEVARVRQLAEQARTDPGAAEILHRTAESAVTVIRSNADDLQVEVDPGVEDVRGSRRVSPFRQCR